MRFIIRVLDGPFPFPELGPHGAQLAGYIPAGVKWKLLNYGQGEGQVEIDGCEWGFYQADDPNSLAVHLHIGKLPAVKAIEFVQQVAEATCGGKRFEIFAQGTAVG
jgi:hypothetical protein